MQHAGIRAAIRHYRTVGLHHAHTALDRRFHPSAARDLTTGKAELDSLTIASPHRATGVHYLPTPWRILDWIHDELPVPDADWTFIDYGCGKGRAVVSAAARPYGRVVGVEFASELATVAREVVRQAPARRQTAIDIHEADAAAFPVPATPVVAFMFNPFGQPVVERVVAGLARASVEHRQPIVIAYLNPVHQRAVSSTSGFVQQPLSRRGKRRFGLASPYRLALFANTAFDGHREKQKGWR